MPKKHFFLVSTLVFYKIGELERSKPINALMIHDEPEWNLDKLRRTQHAAMTSYHTIHDQKQETAVFDVFIQGIAYMGHMTQEEWTGQPVSLDPQIQAEMPATEQDNAEVQGE